MYPPQQPQSGLHRVKILAIEEVSTAYIIRYDIATGPCTGWATYMYQQTGKWFLIWRLDKQRGSIAIKCAVHAINNVTHNLSTLNQAVGKHLCLQLNAKPNGNIDVQKSLPVQTLKIHPNDIRVGTTGGWSKGSQNVHQALLLAALSGLPHIYADVHEIHSPMVEWCAEHNTIIVPRYFSSGDYMAPGGSVIVDRKANILELCRDFSHSTQRKSYEEAAISAQVDNKKLVYVVGTEPRERVQNISDLKGWHATLKGKVFDGSVLYNHILRYQNHFPNTDFIFINREKMCETIHGLIS